MPALPTRPQDITPALLTEVLGELRPGVDVKDVRIVEVARCGDGRASTSDRLKLALSYRHPGEPALPERMVLKTILLHPALRFGLPMILGLARTMDRLEPLPLVGRMARPVTYTCVHVYQRYFPHAPAPMYANETRFYRELRPRLDVEEFDAPAAYGAAFDGKDDQFWVLMEDLDERRGW